MNTKEIVALTEKWLEQIRQITVDYKIAISQLEKSRLDYEKQTKKWHQIILPYMLPLITILLIIISGSIAMRIIGCPNPIHIQFQDLTITQTCQ
jgi:hypothetical protein